MSLEAALAQMANVMRHYTYAGLQVSQAYMEAQAGLSLHEVLTPARLDNTEGTHESLAVLARLNELTLAHKEAYGKFMVASTRDLNAAVEQLPQPQRDEQREGVVASLNRQLALQADFYLHRHRWIEAATEIFQLVETKRASVTFSAEGIDFEDDEDLDRFSALLAEIDEIHHIEVEAMAERQACIQRSLAVMAG